MILRQAFLLALLGSALAASANLINFDGLANSANVGDAYLASDGVSFVNGLALRVGAGAPSPSNVLSPTAASLTINSPVNALVASVGLRYASNTMLSGLTPVVPTLSVYQGLNGTGALLASVALPDTSTGFSVYAPVVLSFAGAAKSFVLRDAAFSHILYDDLAFTSQPVPEPSVFAALGLGAAALLRRRRA